MPARVWSEFIFRVYNSIFYLKTKKMAAALVLIAFTNNIHLCSYPSMENRSTPPMLLPFLFSLSLRHNSLFPCLQETPAATPPMFSRTYFLYFYEWKWSPFVLRAHLCLCLSSSSVFSVFGYLLDCVLILKSLSWDVSGFCVLLVYSFHCSVAQRLYISFSSCLSTCKFEASWLIISRTGIEL